MEFFSLSSSRDQLSQLYEIIVDKPSVITIAKLPQHVPLPNNNNRLLVARQNSTQEIIFSQPLHLLVYTKQLLDLILPLFKPNGLTYNTHLCTHVSYRIASTMITPVNHEHMLCSNQRMHSFTHSHTQILGTTICPNTLFNNISFEHFTFK